MSQLVPAVVDCTRCGAPTSRAVYSSIDADTIPVEVTAIVEGRFEQQVCEGCGASFRPEHTMLYVSHQRRAWIVMYPLAQRADFQALEETVERKIVDIIESWVPTMIAERLRGVRPRLVFGQHMLSEAVRAVQQAIDASLLECAKLLTIRRNLPRLMDHGPFELAFERFDEGGAPLCGIHALPSGERTGELALPGDVLAEAMASRRELATRFPDLFERPYVSATRYLLGATV